MQPAATQLKRRHQNRRSSKALKKKLKKEGSLASSFIEIWGSQSRIHGGIEIFGCNQNDVPIVAEAVSACSHSNYNQLTTHYRHRTKNRRQTQT